MKRFLLVLTLTFGFNFVDASVYQNVNDRQGHLIYRVCVPDGWIREETTGDLKDTKLPICTFNILEKGEKIRITLHNFPSNSIDSRIPPLAQINRWKGQIKELEERDVLVIPQSFSGYLGFVFEGPGVLGWAMQLGAEQYRNLENAQERGDVTIKATGPRELLKKKRTSIYKFARSFEMIKEIPLL